MVLVGTATESPLVVPLSPKIMSVSTTLLMIMCVRICRIHVYLHPLSVGWFPEIDVHNEIRGRYQF